MDMVTGQYIDKHNCFQYVEKMENILPGAEFEHIPCQTGASNTNRRGIDSQVTA